MPTATDEKLAENLTNLRVEVDERFGKVDERLAGVETELRTIRRVGAWFLGGLFAGLFSVFVSVVVAAGTVSWNASAVVSEVKHQGERLQKVEERLDGLGEKVQKQLEILIQRTESKSEAAHPREALPPRPGASPGSTAVTPGQSK